MTSTILPADEMADSSELEFDSLEAGPQDPAAAHAASLVVLVGEGAGRACPLEERTVIGRRQDCGLVLFEETVSRRHAQIVRRGNGYWVQDLGSQNSTFVNGTKVAAPARLHDGDRIELDVVTLLFRGGEPAETPGSAGPPRTADDAAQGLLRENGYVERPSEVVTAFPVGEAVGRRTGVNADVKLHAVLAIARNLGNSIHSDQFLADVLESLFQIFPQCARGYVLLADAGRDLRPVAIRQRRDELDNPATVRPLARSIARRAMSRGEALLCSDRPEFGAADEEASIFQRPFDSVMCAPLMVPERGSLGILYLDTQDRERPFSDDDLEVLASVAALTAHAVEHTRLHEQQRELYRREDELAAARRVQRHLLPQEPPHISEYNFFDYYRPALDVGGDYFSYVEMPDGRLAIALGDVAGKGLSAALLMARLTADVRNCLINTPSPADALRKLNELVARQDLAPLRFITLVLCVLDPQRHQLIVANAGHLPPLLRRGPTGGVEPIGADNPCTALGVDAASGYRQSHVDLLPGDTVLLYTDGLNEALNDDDDLYGVDRLLAAFSAASGRAADMSTAVLSDVRRFVGERGYRDDLCLTCFQRAPHDASAAGAGTGDEGTLIG